MISVSLCIPVYKSAEFLPHLFRCIVALDPRPREVLLLDDASPDNSATLMCDFAKMALPALSIRIVSNELNAGIAAAYNRLAREASSDWIHIMDADDYPVESDFYARMSADSGARYGLMAASLQSNSTLLQWGSALFSKMVPTDPPLWLPLLGSFATRSGVIYRRELLLEHPFRDPAFPGSDVLHFLQLRTKHRCLFVRKAHLYYRVHGGATSSGERSYESYREGLRQLGWIVETTHKIDLGLRMLGQRISRH